MLHFCIKKVVEKSICIISACSSDLSMTVLYTIMQFKSLMNCIYSDSLTCDIDSGGSVSFDVVMPYPSFLS